MEIDALLIHFVIVLSAFLVTIKENVMEEDLINRMCRRISHVTSGNLNTKNRLKKDVRNLLPPICVPGMALVQTEKVRSRVFAAKCSEPQVHWSNLSG